MSQCNFHVGQKVVFVGQPGERVVVAETLELSTLPDIGDVFTVTAMEAYYKGNCLGSPLNILLVDVVFIKLDKWPVDHWFDAGLFRPVVPRKTSIKIFTDILKEVEAKEPVEGLPW